MRKSPSRVQKFNRILLFSGGIDSYVAWLYLKYPQTLYFDVHSRYSKIEKQTVSALIPSTIFDFSLNLRSRESGENAYIPFRNLLLAAQAVKYSDNIIIAGVKDDKVSDKNAFMFSRFSSILSDMEERMITVTSPFWNMTKSDVVKWYVDQKFAPATLLKTVSCYNNQEYCGACPACFRKWCALTINGYTMAFKNKELAVKYLEKAKNNVYDEQRNREIIKVVTEYYYGVG